MNTENPMKQQYVPRETESYSILSRETSTNFGGTTPYRLKPRDMLPKYRR